MTSLKKDENDEMNGLFKNYRNFFSAVNIRLFSMYLGLILVIPVITIIVEYLITYYPSFRTNLQINLQDFHIYQLFTSSFVHENFSHFLGNVSSYLLIITYGLILATILNRNRLYFTLTKVIVLTFLMFGACFTFFNLTTTYYVGLSGINAALTGLLLMFWLMFLGQRSGRSMRSYYGVAVSLVLALAMGIIARYLILYHAAKGSPLESWLVVMGGLFILSVGMFRLQFVDLYHTLGGVAWSPRLLTLGIVIICGYFVWNTFPTHLANSTRVISVSLHVSGIILGILVGYLFTVYLDRTPRFDSKKPSEVRNKD